MLLALGGDRRADQQSTQAVRDAADAAPLQDSFGRDEMARRGELESGPRTARRRSRSGLPGRRPRLRLDLPKVVGSRGVREAT